MFNIGNETETVHTFHQTEKLCNRSFHHFKRDIGAEVRAPTISCYINKFPVNTTAVSALKTGTVFDFLSLSIK